MPHVTCTKETTPSVEVLHKSRSPKVVNLNVDLNRTEVSTAMSRMKMDD